MLHEHGFRVRPESRAGLLRQTPAILWLTGLSAAGKSAIANVVEARLHAAGQLTYILDGDSVRLGLCRDLGFAEADRHENVRRVAEVAKLMADAGLVVLVCLISPFRRDRELARLAAGSHNFAEIHVHASLAVAEARDPKGLYRLARCGAIQHFTGIDSPYEQPASPDVFIDTCLKSIDEGADMVMTWLRSR
ncbi:adenylyl-sulfate kinase [Paraburkholderia phenoliruptrix]|uniref:Adenylyl-sulfate kinase n=1 Tax=Paraburkholderia phenoliruptrix TaxID=252970 RepID=A0ABV3WL37_9BURK